MLIWNMGDMSVNRSKNIYSMSYETLMEALDEQVDGAEQYLSSSSEDNRSYKVIYSNI